MGFSFNNNNPVSGAGFSLQQRHHLHDRIKRRISKKNPDSRLKPKEHLTPENIIFLESLGYKVKDDY